MGALAIVSALTSIAPSLAKLFGGSKAEDAANSIADLAKKVTGIEDTQDAVNQVISDPQKQLEFMKAVDANRIALEQAYLADVQDARTKNSHSPMPAILCCFLSLSVVAFGAALMTMVIPPDNLRLIDTLFGSFLTAWLSSVAYWVGSSRGSAEKTKMMGK